MPSVTETFGNVTTEAMASGLPVLAFNYAAAADLIKDGVNGRVTPLGDGDEFIKAAVALAGEPGLRERIGTEARRTALELDWKRVVQNFEAVLYEVMDRAQIEGSKSTKDYLLSQT